MSSSCATACLFCKIIRGEIPCAKIAENAHALAFMDINPLSKGHALIIPKEHQVLFHQLSEDSAVDLARLLRKVTRALGAQQQYNILNNNGPLAHQVVQHVHFHVIPKSPVDGLVIRWSSVETSQQELAKVAQGYAEKIAEQDAAAEGKGEEKK